MKLNQKSIHALLLAGMLAFAFALAGCSDSSSTTTYDSTGAANQAATDSGITSFDAMTESDAATLGNAASGATDASGQNSSDTSVSLTLNPGSDVAAQAGRRIGTALARMAKSSRLMGRLGLGANALTESVTIDETVSCAVSGSVTVTGTISATIPDSAQNATSNSDLAGTWGYTYSDVTIDFDACDDGGGYTFWGQLVWNVNNTFVVDIDDDVTVFTFDFTFDEDINSGWAVTDGTNSYNFTLLSTIDGTFFFDILTNTISNIDITFTLTVADLTSDLTYSCTATITSEAEFDNPTITCTTS